MMMNMRDKLGVLHLIVSAIFVMVSGICITIPGYHISGWVLVAYIALSVGVITYTVVNDD